MEPFNIEAEMASSLDDMSEDDLRSFAGLHGDPANDLQIELYIYTHFLIFTRTRSTEHLEQAIQRTEGWIAVTAADHPDRARRLRILDMMSAEMSQRRLVFQDLMSMLSGISQGLTHNEASIQIGLLSGQAARLAEKYQHTGSVRDLNEAIRIMEQAIDMAGRYISPAMLSNLGVMLGTRFERTGSMNDLDRAVDVTTKAVDATPQNHPDRAGRLSNLGNWLGTRFERTGSMDDLDRGVDVATKAVDATPQDHPDRAGRLNNLGHWLGRRFERTGSMDDLDRAVDVTTKAVDATPQNHPNRAGRLNNLGNWLGRRFERTGSMDDLDRQLSSYREGWSCRTAPPSTRIRLARHAAGILISQPNWGEASLLLQEAVNLLPTVSPRSLKHTDKQHMLADFAGLASMAAATSLNAGKEADHALQLLELGRGVIAGLLMDMRGDISDLEQKHPILADEFVSLRDELDSPVDSPTVPSSGDNTSSWESQAKRRREADQKFSELITRIRAQPGFHNFLLPPTADELMAAADPDPIIVVNLSTYRCDAFLIQRDRIRVLELPRLKVTEVQKRARDLRPSSFNLTPLLEWLWDVLSCPILEALGFENPVSDDNWPRVWWIPTGPLSQLPLHAAGYHMRGSSETVLDMVMSSYTSSIKALLFGRRHHVREPAGPRSNQALLVAMRETPGLSTLRYAVAEVDMLDGLCPSLQLTPIKPTLHKDDVLNNLRASRIFHFAGHGQSDPVEPSQSCLLLEDWKTNPLTVGDLRDQRLQENLPFLGYLSACSTGANKVDKLADEGIHLISAMQLAGFRHVVGTLWEVSDEHCVDVAKVFYQTLRDEGMTDVTVCRGLHRAVRALRDGQIGRNQKARKGFSAGSESPNTERSLKNMYWIPYVHFGV
ncbi:hypothetical protein RB599_010631 [Gaeumannomyces hyphopodioides]